MAVQLPFGIQSAIPTHHYAALPSILKPLHLQNMNPPPKFKTLQMMAAPFSPRPVCPNCSKPSSLCLCLRFRNPGLDNKVSVTILQHRKERNHPLNSARIARLGLANVSVKTISDVIFDARITIRLLQRQSGHNGFKRLEFDEVLKKRETQKMRIDYLSENSFVREELNSCCEFKGTVFTEENEPRTDEVVDEPIISAVIKEKKRPKFDQILGSQVAADAFSKGFVVQRFQKRQKFWCEELEEYEEFEIVVPSGSLLLFPSQNALSIDEVKGMDVDVNNLIVLDGTWTKARRMYWENPWLRLLPHLKLDVDMRSLYGEVRPQPKAGYLSTIESIVYTLKMLGDNPESLDNLLDVFESMVEDQRRCQYEAMSKRSSI
ncbi:hypothetical protein Tsubulata_040020 [Turnera subulata]|uniref:tRNA-uridine aminocarboxypropyltransferase n=1 Tax=Turnera subulata TaxID=218843 RepID=A0A9Q0GFU9_9ROSI|nr:hypothetical protein Tsubulata_040020 [Turnera subulata]